MHRPSRPFFLLTAVVALTAVSVGQTPASPGARSIDTWTGLAQGSLGSILMPRHDIKVSSRAAGIVEKIHVTDGSAVKKDDPIISLDSRLEAAELASAEATLRGTEAELQRAANELRRVTLLREQDPNMVPDKDFDSFIAQEAVARSRRDQSRASVTASREKLENRVIRSPIDGIYLKTNKSVGEAVERFEPIARVVDPSMLELTIYCDTSLLGRFAAGQTVTIQVQNPQKKNPQVEGTIRHVDPFVDTTSSTFRIIIDVQPSDVALAGLHATLLMDRPAATTAQR